VVMEVDEKLEDTKIGAQENRMQKSDPKPDDEISDMQRMERQSFLESIDESGTLK